MTAPTASTLDVDALRTALAEVTNSLLELRAGNITRWFGVEAWEN